MAKVSHHGAREHLYQIEVKLILTRLAFNPLEGWSVTVHIDPMELGRGGQHPADKQRRADAALVELEELGVQIGAHEQFGKVDLVAEHSQLGCRLIEVEGDSSRQPDQALYSALGQILLTMRAWGDSLRYGIAIPDGSRWVRQFNRVPAAVRKRLLLDFYVVGRDRVLTVAAEEALPDWRKR